jgi:iron complex transport system substrate-binding protein
MVRRGDAAGGVSRRRLLFAVLASGFPILDREARSAVVSKPHGVVALDWTIAEACLALGVTPIGVPAPLWYNLYAVTPALPSGVTDVGLLFAPNFEIIQELAPGAILTTPALAPARSLLDRIAATQTFSISAPGEHVFERAEDETKRLADAFGDAEAFAALSRQTHESIGRAGRALAGYDQRALYVLNVIDDRHVRLYGPGSLYDAVLVRLGLRNAWRAPSSLGFSIASLEALTADPDARALIIRTVGGSSADALLNGPFWQALPFVRQKCVHVIDAVMASGGLPSAARFAGLVGTALSTQDPTP